MSIPFMWSMSMARNKGRISRAKETLLTFFTTTSNKVMCSLTVETDYHSDGLHAYCQKSPHPNLSSNDHECRNVLTLTILRFFTRIQDTCDYAGCTDQRGRASGPHQIGATWLDYYR